MEEPEFSKSYFLFSRANGRPIASRDRYIHRRVMGGIKSPSRVDFYPRVLIDTRKILNFAPFFNLISCICWSFVVVRIVLFKYSDLTYSHQ